MTTQELLDEIISNFIETRRTHEPTIEELRERACVIADIACNHIMTTEDLDDLCSAWVTYCGQYDTAMIQALPYVYHLMAQRSYNRQLRVGEPFTEYLQNLMRNALSMRYYLGE